MSEFNQRKPTLRRVNVKSYSCLICIKVMGKIIMPITQALFYKYKIYNITCKADI